VESHLCGTAIGLTELVPGPKETFTIPQSSRVELTLLGIWLIQSQPIAVSKLKDAPYLVKLILW
jgi:hypothetical protein